MYNKLKLFFITVLTAILLSLLCSFALSAQDTLRIDLNKALEIALSDNPTIQLANKEIERQYYYKDEVRGGFFPTLSGSAQYSRYFDLPVLFLPENIFGPGTGGPMQMGFDNSYNAALSLSLPLFAPSLFKMIQVSNTDIEIALEKSRASKLDMVSEVKKAFYTLLLAKNSFDVMSMSIENAKKNLESIKNLYGQGVVAEYDVIRSEVQVRNLNPAFVQAENGVSLSAMMLKILLGVGEDIEIEVDGNLSDYENDFSFYKPLINISLDKNTNLIQLDLQQLKLTKQYELLRTNRLPTLAAFGNFQYQAQANDFNISDYNWVKTTLMGLQLQVPIFQGFTKKYREQQVLVGIDQLKIQRDYLNQTLTLQARNAITNMMRAVEQINSNKEAIAQAERGYSIAQTRYRTGTGTILELNDAEVSLTQAKLNYNQSLFDYLKAKVDYEAITGENEALTNYSKN
jgi:outer membrane protein TolC